MYLFWRCNTNLCGIYQFVWKVIRIFILNYIYLHPKKKLKDVNFRELYEIFIWINITAYTMQCCSSWLINQVQLFHFEGTNFPLSGSLCIAWVQHIVQFECFIISKKKTGFMGLLPISKRKCSVERYSCKWIPVMTSKCKILSFWNHVSEFIAKPAQSGNSILCSK